MFPLIPVFTKYLVFYRPGKSGVEILHIFHSAQDIVSILESEDDDFDETGSPDQKAQKCRWEAVHLFLGHFLFRHLQKLIDSKSTPKALMNLSPGVSYPRDLAD